MIDSRLGREGEEIRRRRECEECGRRFTTRERVEEMLPKIIKRDERREEFYREKLARCRCARPARSARSAPTRWSAWWTAWSAALQERARRRSSTRFIGELVLEELVALDPLAAARFASVFRDFENAEDYAAFFARSSVGSAAFEATWRARST